MVFPGTASKILHHSQSPCSRHQPKSLLRFRLSFQPFKKTSNPGGGHAGKHSRQGKGGPCLQADMFLVSAPPTVGMGLSSPLQVLWLSSLLFMLTGAQFIPKLNKLGTKLCLLSQRIPHPSHFSVDSLTAVPLLRINFPLAFLS